MLSSQFNPPQACSSQLSLVSTSCTSPSQPCLASPLKVSICVHVSLSLFQYEYGFALISLYKFVWLEKYGHEWCYTKCLLPHPSISALFPVSSPSVAEYEGVNRTVCVFSFYGSTEGDRKIATGVGTAILFGCVLYSWYYHLI